MQTVRDIDNQEGYISLPIAYVHDAILAWEHKSEQYHYNFQDRQLRLHEYQAHTARIIAYGQLKTIDEHYDVARRNDETERFKNQTEHMKVNASITFDATVRMKDQTQRIAILLGSFVAIVASASTICVTLINALNL